MPDESIEIEDAKNTEELADLVNRAVKKFFPIDGSVKHVKEDF